MREKGFNKTAAWLTVICMLATMLVTAWLPLTALAAGEDVVWHGNGSSDDPFMVESADHLNDIRNKMKEGKFFFEQTADINLIESEVYTNWDPIGDSDSPFTGTYDGGGYTITNLLISYNDKDYIGLFGFVGSEGTLKNIGLKNINVYAGPYTGGLAGCNEGTIECSYSTGQVDVETDETDTFIGGLVGWNKGIIRNSCSTGNIKCESEGGVYAGGLAGWNENGTIEYSYSTSSVTGTGDDPKIGGLVGWNENGTVIDSYYDSDTSGQNDNTGKGVPKPTEEMMLQDTFENWDFSGTWFIDETRTYPLLDWQVSEVATPEDLYNVRYKLNNYFIQVNDINLAESVYANWDPIGTNKRRYYASAFQGIYNGNGKTISNLSIDQQGEDNAGLFGYSYNAIFKSIKLKDVNIIGEANAGSLVGAAVGSEGIIEGCSSSGSINGQEYVGGLVGSTDVKIIGSYSDVEVSGTDGVGGLVGNASNTVIENSYAKGSVSGSGENVGGLIGEINDTSINNSYATGDVSGINYVGGLIGSSANACSISQSCATGNVSGETAIGGLIGQANTRMNIYESHASGVVTGTGQLVGGFAGAVVSSIYNSYSKGDVKGDAQYMGGFAGGVAGNIYNSYSRGEVSETGTDRGGFAGIVVSGIIKDSYYDSETSGQSDTGKGIPKDTAEMMQEGTYITTDSEGNPNGTWDFTNTWGIIQGYTYPALKWQGQTLDEDIILATIALTWDIIKGDNSAAENVTTGLYLPIEGANGTTLSWSSSDTAVIANNGTIIRPTSTQGDKTVTLTATISKGGGTPQSKEFRVTVKAESGGSGPSGGGSDSGGSSYNSAGDAINQAAVNGQGYANIPVTGGGTLTLNSQNLSQINGSNITLNLQYPEVEIGINPNSLPIPQSGGSIQINAVPVTDPDTLNTLYVMAPDGRGVGAGYSITINEVVNGQSNSITQLGGEINLTFQLDEEDLEGIDPASLRVYKMDEATGNLVELGGEYLPGESAISVSTSHLCKFIIMGKVFKERIYGDDRYGTAAAISKKGWEKSDNVIIAYGEDYPDALTGVALAGLKDAPILLTMKHSLNEYTLKEIERLGAKDIYIIGGTGVIQISIELQLKQKYNVERIEGKDRYNTAVQVGQKVKKEKEFDTVIIATGLDFPDAMAIAPFAAKEGTPILYTSKDTLNEDTEKALKDWGIKKVIIAGGPGVVSNNIEEYIKNKMGIEVKRIYGTDRYLTSLEIAKYYGADYDYKSIVISTGEIFADALCGAPFAAKGMYPVILAGRDNINKDIPDYVGDLKIDRVYILGGPGAVSDEVKEKIH